MLKSNFSGHKKIGVEQKVGITSPECSPVGTGLICRTVVLNHWIIQWCYWLFT